MSYLVLSDGKVFEGTRFGANAEARGELVFNTGMTGYLEAMADPRYDGQMLILTFPLVGNVGAISEDLGGQSPKLRALIAREVCDAPSNFRCEGTLHEAMERMGVPGLSGVDTRELTRILRNEGVMNAALVDELPGDLDAFCAALRADAPIGGVAENADAEFATVAAENSSCRVVAWDFGARCGIDRALAARGCEVVLAPASATGEQIMALKPDGVALLSGAGDPAVNERIIAEIGRLAGAGVPILAIGLGHQMLAISQGAKTEKLKYGHRGANQPVRDVRGGKVYTTSQNHGYVVSADLPGGMSARYINANDQTVEGIEYEALCALSLQFCPDAESDSLGTGFIYDAFIAQMGGTK